MQCLAVPPGLKLVTCPSLPASEIKRENNSDKHWTTLAYTFSKLGDNLTNNDEDILIDISNCTSTPSAPQKWGVVTPHITSIRLSTQNGKKYKNMCKLFTKPHARGGRLGTCTSLRGVPYPVGPCITRPCPKISNSTYIALSAG